MGVQCTRYTTVSPFPPPFTPPPPRMILQDHGANARYYVNLAAYLIFIIAISFL